MDEEKDKKQPTEDIGDGDITGTTPLIDAANAAAERMEKANEEARKILDRQEAIEQRRRLGGGSEAGVESKSGFTEEEKESRKRIKAVADASGASWGKNYE